MTPSNSQESTANGLHFAILDESDLGVMSAHLQDAELKVADTAFLSASRRFALVVCRIDWESFAKGQPARRETGFHFAHVLGAQRMGFGQDDRDLSLQLLAIAFEPGDAPAGRVVLTFAGHRRIALDVECLEAEMRDLGPCWPVEKCPKHDLDGSRAAG